MASPNENMKIDSTISAMPASARRAVVIGGEFLEEGH